MVRSKKSIYNINFRRKSIPKSRFYCICYQTKDFQNNTYKKCPPLESKNEYSSFWSLTMQCESSVIEENANKMSYRQQAVIKDYKSDHRK